MFTVVVNGGCSGDDDGGWQCEKNSEAEDMW